MAIAAVNGGISPPSGSPASTSDRPDAASDGQGCSVEIPRRNAGATGSGSALGDQCQGGIGKASGTVA